MTSFWYGIWYLTEDEEEEEENVFTIPGCIDECSVWDSVKSNNNSTFLCTDVKSCDRSECDSQAYAEIDEYVNSGCGGYCVSDCSEDNKPESCADVLALRIDGGCASDCSVKSWEELYDKLEIYDICPVDDEVCGDVECGSNAECRESDATHDYTCYCETGYIGDDATNSPASCFGELAHGYCMAGLSYRRVMPPSLFGEANVEPDQVSCCFVHGRHSIARGARSIVMLWSGRTLVPPCLGIGVVWFPIIITNTQRSRRSPHLSP